MIHGHQVNQLRLFTRGIIVAILPRQTQLRPPGNCTNSALHSTLTRLIKLSRVYPDEI